MSECIFKSIYFPKDRTRASKSVRVTISIPTKLNQDGFPETFLTYAQSLSSRNFRLALGDPFLEDLEQQAEIERKSLSDICINLLLQHYNKCTFLHTDSNPISEEFTLPLDLSFLKPVNQNKQKHGDIGVTFRESHHQGVHSWYPYVEGFSATYVRDALLRNGSLPRTIYDPFGGAGTTQLVASCLGVNSFYSEVNPFMAFVAETKLTAASWAKNNLETVREVAEEYLCNITPEQLEKICVDVDVKSFEAAFPERNFFEEKHLRHLLAARNFAQTVAGQVPHVYSLLVLACAANAVHSSNMTRRADLRRRRANEYKTRIVDVSAFITKTVRQMIEDIERLPVRMAKTIKVSSDCRQIPPEFVNSFDMVITSPPYLNGTNYFRNTKIELWLLDFIKSEKDLAGFRRQAITAGINNVNCSTSNYNKFDSVETIAKQLDKCSKDKRIPLLIRGYFSDMQDFLSVVYGTLVPEGLFFLDIGDSKFYGVHVPTDILLAEIAESIGFIVKHKHLLAKRYSKDKSELVQVELVLQKPAQSFATPTIYNINDIHSKIDSFAKSLPYKATPYNSRIWGHKLHSLCSYQGKLKPAIAHWLVKTFVPENGRVLDPLGGVGTIAFEAAITGRFAVSNDKSPLASTIAIAKLNPPSLEDAKAALQDIEKRMAGVVLSSKDYKAATFGLNATVADYYHPKTLDEILQARQVFIRDGRGNHAETFVWASLLHILHGNRPYALSRISHPITPFSPKGEVNYKPLVKKVWEKIERALKEGLPDTFRVGSGYQNDFRNLLLYCQDPFDAIITSPPFFGMRFDRPNWLRLWFCGWDEDDFHKTSLDFLERQQTQSMNCYVDFFDTCYNLLTPKGILIIHIGESKKGNMVSEMKRLASKWFNLISDVCENVQSIEQHGISDKGLTINHHFLFFKPIYP
jgi:DNA modification methylase